MLLPPHVADIDGDGQLGPVDEQLAQTALFSHRGFNLAPAPSFDHRADVFGRGVVDSLVLDSVTHSINTHGAEATIATGRPITIAWHYAWYNTLERPTGSQTVRFKGGNYLSDDPEVETVFNDLKNEFGVTVDALSWIPRRFNKDNQDNYRSGFLKAPNVDTRHVALLYESTIALPVRSGRVDFQSPPVQFFIREDFAEMARFFAEVRDESPARVFTLDGRPVVFIFGSHTWGLFPVRSQRFQEVDRLLIEVREIFRDIYGTYPYLVGEEIVLSSRGRFADDRLRRTLNFDAIYIYHHASNLKPGVPATLFITQPYLDNQLNILAKTYTALSNLRNRFTGQRVLIMPNLAPGFAKPGMPTLQIDRSDYTDFMKLIQQFHLKEYIFRYWGLALGSALLPAPIYITGSWNEEFEGHAIFPADFNLALSDVVQQGFDMCMAIKEAFGWNHYAQREIGVTPPPPPTPDLL